MKQVGSEEEFRELLRQRYRDLPPQQELVGQYLLEHLHEVPFLSVPELSEKSGASEATVVRFAQRLGYSGFAGLKMDLLDALRQKVTPRAEAPAHRPLEPGDVESLRAVERQEVQNIHRTVDQLDRAAFRRVTARLFKADHVFTFGLGVSSHFAEILNYLLAEIGLRSTTLSTRFSSPLEQLVSLRPTDLVVVFSFPPYSRASLQVLERARELGVPTVAICDRETAPAANLAGQFLTVKSDNLLFTNSLAAVAALLNALITEIAVRHQDQALEALSRINRILDEDGALIEDSR